MKISNSFLSAVAAACLISVTTSSMALNLGDEEKLKELERAMSGASSSSAEGEAPLETLTKKKRTRAIVFDSEQQADATTATKTTVAAVAKPTRIQDCKAPPTDVRITPVDFAIQFKAGSADVAPSSEDTLRQIAKILSLSPDKCVLIEGHSDASGNPDSNLSLSRDRANSVYKFIVDKSGMDAGRITAVGKGQSEPLKNLDPRDPKNRRVVFKVVG